MNLEILARVIGLVKTNGDKVVLADPTSGDGVVVMGLEQYEALCAQLAVLTAEAGVVITPPAAPAPVAAPAPLPVVEKLEKTEKTAPQSQKAGEKPSIKVTPETMGATHILADLTQEQLVDRINRDIGTWKTAQEKKKAEKPADSAPQQPATPSEPENGIEDEERFFLEPIE